jgi:ABC-2 type transport system permease protein
VSSPLPIRRFDLFGDLRLVLRQVRYEQQAFWLNKVGAVFTIIFSVVFLVFLGIAAGNSRVSGLGDVKEVQYYVPGFVAYGVMAACFTMLSINLVVRRETGLLKRLRLTPLPAWALLAAIFISTLLVALVQVVVLLAIGRFAFGVQPPGALAAFVVALLVGALSFTALGTAMASLVPNQESAGPVTSTIFFVLLFLSGLYFYIPPHSGLSEFASYFPVRHFILAVFSSFNTQRGVSPWDWADLRIVALWGVIGTGVAIRRFRWSPRRG